MEAVGAAYVKAGKQPLLFERSRNENDSRSNFRTANRASLCQDLYVARLPIAGDRFFNDFTNNKLSIFNRGINESCGSGAEKRLILTGSTYAQDLSEEGPGQTPM